MINIDEISLIQNFNQVLSILLQFFDHFKVFPELIFLRQTPHKSSHFKKFMFITTRFFFQVWNKTVHILWGQIKFDQTNSSREPFKIFPSILLIVFELWLLFKQKEICGLFKFHIFCREMVFCFQNCSGLLWEK